MELNGDDRQQAEGFAWRRPPAGLALVCLPLERVAAHFFTTRDLWLRGGGAEITEWPRVAASVEVPPDRLVRVRQVHGADVLSLSRTSPAPVSPERAPADVIVSDDPSLAIAVQVADCVPILIADRRKRAVAAVHAGWRGTAVHAVEVAAHRLEEDYGIDAVDLVAALGPSIGPCCYEVGDELIDTFRQSGHAESAIQRWFVRQDGGRYRLDLWRANHDQLLAAGIPAGQVHVAGLCTAHNLDLFYSYRAEGAQTGRMTGVIRARGVEPASRAHRLSERLT